jgi:hypothetical protein
MKKELEAHFLILGGSGLNRTTNTRIFNESI